ncbi:mitochondrial carrier domain-containing protein [Talaromyces proteolyticus]|uniref:Mitochondrial carrier domain-containing protein n=1 Tax=Talaromyces proteolyticus TaxID=1131652 RepID=A0AAD4KNG8_9EURO|nr:mitochondrial carrier domain-containing protein [Talaromyces proteolyticus]KAH8693145.1 mitochondrial carrier domain-containing protein [Talaromyces proteolyticus]
MTMPSDDSAPAPAASHEQQQHAPAHLSRQPANRLLTRLEVYSTRIPAYYITPFCGALAGVASGIVTCPLDVIKTKLQAQGGFARRRAHMSHTSQMYRGMIGTGTTIWKNEGIRGLYQGLGPMLLGYLPTWAVYLTVYDQSRAFFEQKTDNWWLSRTYASVTAGACSTIATNPIWVIKTRLMSQSGRVSGDGFIPWHYRNSWDAARKMYMTEGIRAFYSGLTPALLGLTHVAIQFPLYEYFKMAFTGYGIGEHPGEGDSHWIGISLATFLSKVCASTATYPHEVLRTRLQTQQRHPPTASPEEISFRGGFDHPVDRGRPPGASSSDGMPNRPRYAGVWRTCQTILREEGWRAFYSGIGTNLIRAVPAAMTTMLTYEYLRKTISTLQHEGEKKMQSIEVSGDTLV